jgi:hypothetical protein
LAIVFRANNTFCPFLMAVSIMDLSMAKFSAAYNILICPDIFCFTFAFRISLSDTLLSGGTSGW